MTWIAVADLDRAMDDAGRHLPFLRLGLADGELELLIAGIAELLAELDDARLAASDLGRQGGRRQPQHLVGIVDDVLADLTIARRHAVELRIDPVQDGHGISSTLSGAVQRNKIFQFRLTAKNAELILEWTGESHGIDSLARERPRDCRLSSHKVSAMDRLRIVGGQRLEGAVTISGAKNAALPQIAAALLSPYPLELTNLPAVTDVENMLRLSSGYGAEVTRSAHVAADRRRAPSRNETSYDTGAEDARHGARAGAAAGPVRPRPGFAAGRLRHRRAAGRPASRGARGARRRGSPSRTATSSPGAERADRRAHRA